MTLLINQLDEHNESGIIYLIKRKNNKCIDNIDYGGNNVKYRMSFINNKRF